MVVAAAHARVMGYVVIPSAVREVQTWLERSGDPDHPPRVVVGKSLKKRWRVRLTKGRRGEVPAGPTIRNQEQRGRPG